MPKKLTNITNQEIADIFYEIADILEILNIEFKPRAYRRAAQEIESLPGPIQRYYKENTIDDIPSIGKAIEKKIIELLETGKLNYLKKIKKQLPSGLSKLMQIPGMGPKKISRLHKELSIKTITDLKRAIKNKEIQKLKGFGEKSEQDIKENLTLTNTRLRKPYKEVFKEAKKLKSLIEKIPETEKVEIAGSLRRKKSTIKDIDLLVQSTTPKPIMQKFTKNKFTKKVLAKGETKSAIITKSDIQVDLRVIPRQSWGAALAYFTGPKNYNVQLRRIAIKKGYKLSEYGLYNRQTGKFIAGKTEKSIYKALNLKYVEPEDRENN
jgi:DNA polymerase (family 10)